jgi:sterol 3beta-glucosyltransferase
MLRVALLTTGTRGDVQPFVALARGLQQRGCSVTLAAPSDVAALAARHGVPTAPMRASYQALLASDEGQAMLGSPLRAVRYWRSVVLPLVRATIDDAWAAAQGADGRGADLVIHHPKLLGGAEIAERLGVPAVVATPVPLVLATREFPAPGVATHSLGSLLNRASYLPLHLAARLLAGEVRRWRARVHANASTSRDAAQRRRPGAPYAVLHAHSAHLVPRPADWPAWAHVTGDWPLDRDDPPPADDPLHAFLAAGAPPVYVGFGSMGAPGPLDRLQVVLDAVERSGQRAVLALGDARAARAGSPDGTAPAADEPARRLARLVDAGRVHLVRDVSHPWLFARCSAVVHHGGAGTTAAGLRAGRPTVVCPVFGDQSFWGARVQALGAGPAPLPQRTLAAPALAAAIHAAVHARHLSANARALGERLRAEQGVLAALDALRPILQPHGAT